jgi:hypothetical protein
MAWLFVTNYLSRDNQNPCPFTAQICVLWNRFSLKYVSSQIDFPSDLCLSIWQKNDVIIIGEKLKFRPNPAMNKGTVVFSSRFWRDSICESFVIINPNFVTIRPSLYEIFVFSFFYGLLSHGHLFHLSVFF